MYVRGPKNLLEGLLNSPNFNFNKPLSNLTDDHLLLEGPEDVFDSVIQHIPTITTMTEAESKEYLENNYEDWFEPDPIGGQ